tara:strand:+ start:832 stop:1881 length:1050 start_codon:yes stop_codon:yes gene_type:complete
MSNLLEEAIVDAKALKEAAMKNAQAAIVEKYSDEVKQAVDSLLNEQDPMDSASPSPSSDVVSSIPVGAMDGEVADKEMCGCPEEDEEIEITLPAIAAAADMDGEVEPSELEPELDMAPELPIEDEEDELEEDLINTILSALNEGEGPEVEVTEDKTEQHEMPAMEETEPLAKAKELQQEREEDDHKTSEAAAKEEPATAHLKEDVDTLQQAFDILNRNNETLKTANEKLEGQNNKLTETIKSLSEHFDALALQNAKLLYTNKVLKVSSLNERQKDRIVGAIDETKTPEQAKMVFETLQGAVGASNSKGPESLSEVVSKPSSLIVSRKTQETKTDPVANRWKLLAGIKNK